MFDVIKKLLLARQLSFEEGEIKLLGQSITMMPIIIYIEMLKELKKIEPSSYKQVIYKITKTVGKKYTQLFKDKYKMKKSQEIATWDVNTLALSGLGKGQVIKYDTKNKTSLVKVTNSPVAKELTPSKEPVDIIIAGYIAGASTIAFNSEKMECKEIKCEAMGDQYCLFEVYEARKK